MRLSPVDAICSILRSRLRSEPLPTEVEGALVDCSRDDIGWVRAASRHRIGPALGACLQASGLSDRLPADLRFYFEDIRAGNARQNARFLEELSLITRALNEFDVEPCLLKGASALVNDIFPDQSWRFMNDLDLLIPEERLDTSWNRLRALGYRVDEGWIDGVEHHHHPPLWHPERLAYVELHHQVARPRYSRILPAGELFRRSRPLDHSMIGRFRLLHEDDRAILLIAHAQIFNSHYRYGVFRLTDLVEFDCLSTSNPLDIEAIIARFRQYGWGPQCLVFLSLAGRVLGTPAVGKPAINTWAELAVRKSIWLQDRRMILALNIVAGWMVRTLQHAFVDGDWRQVRQRSIQSIAKAKPAPFLSLKQALRDFT